MKSSSSISKTLQQCLAQQELNKRYLRENNIEDENIIKSIRNVCNESSLNAMKRQLDIHERLYRRYTCGEMSRDNVFCRHLNDMRETRKNILKQLERMDMSRMPQPSL